MGRKTEGRMWQRHGNWGYRENSEKEMAFVAESSVCMVRYDSWTCGWRHWLGFECYEFPSVAGFQSLVF